MTYRVTIVNKYYQQYVGELDAVSDEDARQRALAAFDRQLPQYRECRRVLMCCVMPSFKSREGAQ